MKAVVPTPCKEAQKDFVGSGQPQAASQQHRPGWSRARSPKNHPRTAERQAGQRSLPRGQILSRYLEDVLSRVEAGGAAAHHADPGRRGSRGQPPPQTCGGERQAGREATRAATRAGTRQGRHGPSPEPGTHPAGLGSPRWPWRQRSRAGPGFCTAPGAQGQRPWRLGPGRGRRV